MVDQEKIKILDYKTPGSFEETRYEKLHSVILDSSTEGSVVIANYIANLILEKQEKNEKCVLGLATGSSPLSIYKELIRMHKENGLSFQNVITFNLDEYYGLGPQDVQSYTYFMHSNFFDHIDIKSDDSNEQVCRLVMEVSHHNDWLRDYGIPGSQKKGICA